MPPLSYYNPATFTEDGRTEIVNEKRGEGEAYRLGQRSPWPENNIAVKTDEPAGLVAPDHTYSTVSIVSGGDWRGREYAVRIPDEGYISALQDFAVKLEKMLNT
jgi:hypothetical protein